jgi:Holliday junction resolvase RusA-like endonuclease
MGGKRNIPQYLVRSPAQAQTKSSGSMMYGTNQPPFMLPADSLEIVLDLPMPTSTNRLYSHGRKGVYRLPEYVRWMELADITVMVARQFPRRKVTGPFEIEIRLSTDHRGDGDNRIKAALDWLQSRDITRNDSYCRRGSWAWVEPELAPKGCRVILRSLHE